MPLGLALFCGKGLLHDNLEVGDVVAMAHGAVYELIIPWKGLLTGQPFLCMVRQHVFDGNGVVAVPSLPC